MSMNWQVIQQRGQETLAVWQTFAPAFTVGALTFASHQTNVQALPAASQAMQTQQDALDAARAARDATAGTVRDLAVRLPRKLDGDLPPGDALHGDLEDIRTIEMTGLDTVLLRGQRTISLWTKVNARHAAATPPVPAVTVGGGTLANLTAAAAGLPGAEQEVENERSELSDRRSDLRTLAATVDSANKRWYAAWQGEFPAGTPEGDALSQIDTGSPGGGGGTGSSSSSSSSSSSGPLPLPGAPQNVVLTTGDADSGAVVISLDPAPPAEEVTGYHVYRDGVFRAATGGPTVLDGFTPGESVTLTMRALNATGEGPDSAEASGTAG